MAKRVLTPFNFINLTLDPDTAASGDIYYNSASDTLRYYDGESWNDVGTGSGGPHSYLCRGWSYSASTTAFNTGGSWVENDATAYLRITEIAV